jgi:hypothetical protein
VEFLLGALAVGAITLVREWLIESKRWARDDERFRQVTEREDSSYRRTTRAARRLVADELDSNQNHLGMMLRHDAWPVPDVAERANFMPSAEWHAHKQRLAEALDDDDTWEALAAFYYSLDQLRLYVIDYADESLTERDRDRLRLMHDQAMTYRGVLVGDLPLPEDWHAQVEALRAAGHLPPPGERAQS